MTDGIEGFAFNKAIARLYEFAGALGRAAGRCAGLRGGAAASRCARWRS